MKCYSIILLLLFSMTSFQEDNSLRWDYGNEKWTPLMKAIYQGDTKTYSKMIKDGICVTSEFSQTKNVKLTALDVAIRTNNDVAVGMLLNTKQFPKLNDYLITASGQESVKVLELLFDYGADPNYILENGYTPIFMATKFGSREVLVELLKRSKNINKKRNGVTVLMLAARDLNIEKVKILILYGADRNIEDSKGRKAYDYADLSLIKRENKSELITQLKELLK